MKNKNFTGPAILTGLLILAPQAVFAQKADNTAPSRFSDRDRSVDWKKQKEALEQSLKPGMTKEQYQRELEKMGWTITAVNYDKPDYVEWEIVKADHTYEVQIDLDKNNHGNKVDVTTNMWKANATKQALKGNKVASMGRGDARYSDRDHRSDWNKGKEQLEQALKTGQNKEGYRHELEKMGWTITSVNSDRPDYTEWEIVKGDQTYEVQLSMDKNTHKATKVDVTTNMWQADATERALDANRTRTSSR